MESFQLNRNHLYFNLGGAMACRFLQAKWYDLEAKMGAGSINFAKVISAITQYGATKFDYDEVCLCIDISGLMTINISIISEFRIELSWLSFSFISSTVKIVGASIW